MSGSNYQAPAVSTLLAVNTAVNFKAGVPGTAGAANDTVLLTVIILKAAGPPILTINSGFRDQTNANNTTGYVLTGSTTVDTPYYFTPGVVNTSGPLQMTASVANTVIVHTQAVQSGYVG